MNNKVYAVDGDLQRLLLVDSSLRVINGAYRLECRADGSLFIPGGGPRVDFVMDAPLPGSDYNAVLNRVAELISLNSPSVGGH